MKLTKMIASVLTGSLCLSVFCCGCTNTRETEETKDNKPVIDELPEDEVLIRSSHKNGAWGYDSSVTYVFSDGNVYSSGESFEGSQDLSAGYADRSGCRIRIRRSVCM